MNLARVEYYFAKFLSAMELRFRAGKATLELAPNHTVELTPNLLFVGTVNIDETTHGFADKIFDRAQLIELEMTEADLDAYLKEHFGGEPWAPTLLAVWLAVQRAAPFAYRVASEIGNYIREASKLEVSWKEALDEQLVQKVLPKVKGQDTSVGEALDEIITLSAVGHPLTHAKAVEMRAELDAYGFTSFF